MSLLEDAGESRDAPDRARLLLLGQASLDERAQGERQFPSGWELWFREAVYRVESLVMREVGEKDGRSVRTKHPQDRCAFLGREFANRHGDGGHLCTEA